MNELPIECRARFHEITRRGKRLLENFVNGNRKDTLEELEQMEPRAALAVLAVMMLIGGRIVRKDLHRFLKEMA